MWWPFKRNRMTQAVRQLEAASSARRASAWRAAGPINSEIGNGGHTVARRAEHAVRNNALAAAGLTAWSEALVGYGPQATSQHPDAATRAVIDRHFDAWAKKSGFFTSLATIVKSMVTTGDGLAVFGYNDNGLTVRPLAAEQLDRAKSMDLGSGSQIVQGVELNPSGEPLAYWILPARPDGMTGYGESVRIPRDDVLHAFDIISPGQVRGLSWFAPVLVQLSELDALLDALLVGNKIAALNAGFMTDQNGAGGMPMDGQQVGPSMEVSLEPGTVRVLPSGWDIKFNTPQQTSSGLGLAALNTRHIASGLGLPSHLIDGDLSNANYSSLRAGMLRFRQRVEAIQYLTIVPELLDRVHRRVTVEAILSSQIDVPGFEHDPYAATAVEWLMPRQAAVDPVKDTDAEIAQINAGLKSRRQAVAERGYDVDALDQEIAADQAREARLGLHFTTVVATPTPAQE